MFTSGGKPHSIRRGPGRPRKEFILGQRQISKDPNRIVKRTRGGGSGGGIHMRGGMATKRKIISQWNQNGSLLTAPPQDNNFSTNQMVPTTIQQSSVVDDIMVAATTSSLSSTTATATTTAALVPSTSMDQEMSLMPYTGNGDKVMQPPEEPPYFPEKWPGKLCAFCCLGERSQLGQGEMLRLEVSVGDEINSLNSSLDDQQSVSLDEKNPKCSLSGTPQLSNRRQKGLNKCKYVILHIIT